MKKKEIKEIVKQIYQAVISKHVEINNDAEPRDVANAVFALFHDDRDKLRQCIFWLKDNEARMDCLNEAYRQSMRD